MVWLPNGTLFLFKCISFCSVTWMQRLAVRNFCVFRKHLPNQLPKLAFLNKARMQYYYSTAVIIVSLIIFTSLLTVRPTSSSRTCDLPSILIDTPTIPTSWTLYWVIRAIFLTLWHPSSYDMIRSCWKPLSLARWQRESYQKYPAILTIIFCS